MRKKVHVSVGSFEIDIAVYTSHHLHNGWAKSIVWSPGGSATRYAASAVVYGHKAILLATTSRSQLARRYLNKIKTLGVDTRYVRITNGKPGVSIIIIDPRGETRVYEFIGANKGLLELNTPEDVYSDANIAYINTPIFRVAYRFIDQAHRQGVLVTYDLGQLFDTNLDKLMRILNKVDILFINREAFMKLTKGYFQRLFKFGVDKVVVRKGLGRAVLLEHGGIVASGCFKNIGKVRNIVGSSEAFSALFNAVYLDSGDPYKALQYALAASVLKTTCKSSMPCYSREELSKQVSNSIIEIMKSHDTLDSEE